MEVRTLDEIRVRGYEVLTESPGPADAIRFISNGQGDPLRKRGEELPGPAPYTFALHGYSY